LIPAGISKAACESYCVGPAWKSKPDPEYWIGLQHILPSWTFSWYKPHEIKQPVLIMSTVITQTGFTRILKVSHRHMLHTREREREREASNFFFCNFSNIYVKSPLILLQCYRGHSGQRRCTCSLLCRVASFGFPQQRHHSKLHDFLFPASRTLRSKDKTS
jgi:hypothetical protein